MKKQFLAMALAAAAATAAGSALAQANDTLAKVNKSMRALGHAEIAELPPVDPAAPRAHIAELFRPEHRAATLSGLCMSVVALVTWWSCNAFIPLVATGLAARTSPVGAVVPATPSSSAACRRHSSRVCARHSRTGAP